MKTRMPYWLSPYFLLAVIIGSYVVLEIAAVDGATRLFRRVRK